MRRCLTIPVLAIALAPTRQNITGRPAIAAVVNSVLIASPVAPLSFHEVSVGRGHTCGLTSDGKAYRWGSNHWGELGDGTTIQRLTPVLVAGGLKFIHLAAGGGFTCGLRQLGRVTRAYCWGSNSVGQLGTGTNQDMQLMPAPVTGNL